MNEEATIVDVRFVRTRDGTWRVLVEGQRVEACEGSWTLSLAVMRLALAHFQESTFRDLPEIRAVLTERGRQRSLGHHDDVDYPDGTGTAMHAYALTTVRHDVQFAEQTNALTWAHVLREEVAEVLAEHDPVRMLEELHQVAAVAVRWAGAIRRRMNK